MAAAESMRPPSPPLPPDPYADQARQQETPVTPQKLNPQELLEQKRVDPSQIPRESPMVPQRQPITDAVNSAANNVFEQSPVTNQMDPDFVRQLAEQVTAQVTEQVMQKLQAAGAGAATPTPSTQPPQQSQYRPPAPSQVQEPRSPTRSSIDTTNAQFTPPSPERSRDGRDEQLYMSSSPEPPMSDAGSSFSRESRDSIRSTESQKSGTPKPFRADSSSKAQRSGPTTRRRSAYGAEEVGAERQGSGSDATTKERMPFRRDSRDSETSVEGASRSRMRAPRAPSDVEETPLEKFWQPLFEKTGQGTTRLSQFLRGLALHIIDDYEPKCSLVVTPEKMLRFFNETRIGEELYPWDIIFGGKLSLVSISMMYQKLLAPHHLVQDEKHRPPTIPGLTPFGFAWFMTCLIQAHPDSEYERLAKAVMNMPISNADNKSERFPKELSRRLLPAQPNIQAEQRLLSSLNHEPYVIGSLKGSASMPPPPASMPPNSFPERERKPYSQTSSQSNAFDDDDLSSPSGVQIERERKPYTAKEGLGKVYASDESSRPPTQQYKPDTPVPPSLGNLRPSRTNSGVPSQATYGTSTPSEPVNIPARNANPHRMSAGQGGALPMANGGHSRSVKRSSPPIRNPYARSEPEFTNNNPTSSTPQPGGVGTNIYLTTSREQYPVENKLDDEPLKRWRSRSRAATSSNNVNNDTTDDPNGGRPGYPIPGRGGAGVPIANAYEYGSGLAAGGPPIGNSVPVGSFPNQTPRRPMGASTSEDRRKSMYAGSTANNFGGFGSGDGGTDGYGSFAGSGMNGNGGYYPPQAQQQQAYGSSAQH